MKEIWKNIDDTKYEISNLGNFKKGKKLIKGWVQNTGYKTVYIKGKKYSVHRLVAQAFIPNLNNYYIVNHKDGNKLNNSVSNLEWCTAKHNNNYGKKINPIYQKDLNGNIIEKWQSITEASKQLSIPISCISECLNYNKKTAGGYIWRWVNEKEEKPLFEIDWNLYGKGDI